MNSPAVDLANKLASSEIGVGTVNTNIFIAESPEAPDNCVTVYDTGGFHPEANYSYDRPTVMVKVRNRSYTAGYAIAEDIKLGLNGLHGESLGGTTYVGIWAMGDINSLGKDDNRRHVFSINFMIHRSAP